MRDFAVIDREINDIYRQIEKIQGKNPEREQQLRQKLHELQKEEGDQIRKKTDENLEKLKPGLDILDLSLNKFSAKNSRNPAGAW